LTRVLCTVIEIPVLLVFHKGERFTVPSLFSLSVTITRGTYVKHFGAIFSLR
jgi:hypothetical protein